MFDSGFLFFSNLRKPKFLILSVFAAFLGGAFAGRDRLLLQTNRRLLVVLALTHVTHYATFFALLFETAKRALKRLTIT